MSKARPGHFKVLYFASASSHTGKEHEELPAPLALDKLFAELDARYPGFQAKILDSCLVTVNLDYVDVPGEGGVTIQEADEVAIIPPAAPAILVTPASKEMFLSVLGNCEVASKCLELRQWDL
ncbi:hypothetical protein B0I35DRAFT_508714 [Stachybotrys elegans]|uniref:Molybdopterin synthase sulfur carrier subunit n=1 Tax=Stachybotrys elegans TaxID=80388 RepID=A0A8K0WVB7_9HYPO|nr:hypothetical protein B0I35DRAFT_508714 [Stachybotrys elegans]